MITPSWSCTGAFTDVSEAERAYRTLQASGVDRMSLVVVEDCPACRYERSDAHDDLLDRMLLSGQVFGGLMGVGLGTAVLWWPLRGIGAVMAGHRWVDVLVMLCTIGTWGLSGAILGAMVAAVVSELVPATRASARRTHRHFVLSLETPQGMEDEVRSILRRSKATLDETPNGVEA